MGRSADIKTGHIIRNFDNAKIVPAWYNMDLQEEKQMKKIVVMLLVTFAMLSLVACGDSFEQGMKDAMNDTSQADGETEAESQETEPESPEPETPAEQEPETAADQQRQESPTVVEYDNLQTVFLALNENTTPDELEKLISESELFYTAEEYNSSSGKTVSYNIAYTEGAAAQKYAEAGDHLTVDFDGDSKDEFMYAQYVNEKDVSYSALLYDHGTWYDFRDANAEDYGGYYVVDSISGKGGITVKYSNGNETETGYIPCTSGEEAIQKIMERISE